MKILLFGGTGFVGAPLVKSLLSKKHEVIVKDIRRDKGWESEVAKVDAIVNLGGTPIFKKRWTYDYKASIYDSRVEANERIARAIDKATDANPDSKKIFISASAIGFYGDRGEELLTETADPATDFLGKVCVDWEEAAFKLKNFNQVRKLAFRFGIILGPHGGALEKMILPFQFFIGGPIGDGQQWTSWVHLDDVVKALVWGLENPTAQGVYNLTSPNPVRNIDFSKALAKLLDRPCWLPVPKLGLRVAVGEAGIVLAGGQKVIPKKLMDEGFEFSYPQVELALKNALFSDDKFSVKK
jgi:uncharacterized protein (TIGR01777 family)